MSLSTSQKQDLEALFGERVTFERLERKLYGHDIAAMPSLIKPLVRRHDARRRRPAASEERARRAGRAGRTSTAFP